MKGGQLILDLPNGQLLDISDRGDSLDVDLRDGLYNCKEESPNDSLFGLIVNGGMQERPEFQHGPIDDWTLLKPYFLECSQSEEWGGNTISFR